MKRRSSGSRPKGGRPFGETSYKGTGLMTRYTRPSGGNSLTMRISGRPARSNGVKNLKGRASSTNYTGDPNVRPKKN